MSDLHEASGCGCGCGCGDSVPRPKDMPDWAAKPDEEIICACAGVTKGQVRQAIEQGAYTLALISVMTGAGRGRERQCQDQSPLGRTCLADLEEMIRLYGTGQC